MIMGLLRVVRYGAEFSLRTRRIIFFIIFFIALTGVTLYAVNEITREDRDLMLSQKVVVLEQANGWESVTADAAATVASEFDPGSAYVIKYVSIPNLKIKIFSLDISQPWANTIVQPDEIRAGNFISTDKNLGNNTYQALASNNQIALDSFSGTNISSVYSVGSIQQFFSNADSERLNLKITGIFEKGINLPKDELWILIAESTFTNLVDLLNIPDSSVFAYHIVVIAPGYSEGFASIFAGYSIPIVEANRLKAEQVKGTDFVQLNPPDINDIKTQAQSTDIILLIGLVGAPIVATMYAFIISRFRTREIAVLKAVGYSNSSVQAMLLSEIGTVSIVGFLISVFGYQLILALNAQYALNTTYVPLIWNPFVDLIPSPTAIITFIFVVLSNVLGFIIISKRSITIRPAELFKNVG
jgi:ABC-type antimicrobial peptide transport system permease subunit